MTAECRQVSPKNTNKIHTYIGSSLQQLTQIIVNIQVFSFGELQESLKALSAALLDRCVEDRVSADSGDSGPSSGIEKLRHRGAITILHGDLQRGLENSNDCDVDESSLL